MEFEAVIGLEVHVQLSTATKLWCGCRTSYAAPANTFVCPICLGMPGTLPVLNQRAVEYAIKLGLALGAKINLYSEFSRKNYFYQDLPQGYQITQYDIPIVENGIVFAEVGEVGEEKYPIEVHLERVHIENDTGKTIQEDMITGTMYSFIDFNRAGIPLLEIVTKPDLHHGKEAYYCLQRLRQIVRFLGICDGNMEEGSLRCDANVSIRSKGEKKLGRKVEVKNINSFRNVNRAINYEIERQKRCFLENKKIIQETRMWDATRHETRSMRTKEEAMDYRYFPEPDLSPLRIEEKTVTEIKKGLPELPDVRRNRFMSEYKISVDDANVLTSTTGVADYYEKLVALSKEPKLSANWVLREVLKIINERAISITEFSIGVERLGMLIDLIKKGTISGKIAKNVFEEMQKSDKNPDEIVKEKGLVQITDVNEIKKIVIQVINENPIQLEQFRSGKNKLFGFFVGQIMKKSFGKANPEIVNELLKKFLN